MKNIFSVVIVLIGTKKKGRTSRASNKVFSKIAYCVRKVCNKFKAFPAYKKFFVNIDAHKKFVNISTNFAHICPKFLFPEFPRWNFDTKSFP